MTMMSATRKAGDPLTAPARLASETISVPAGVVMVSVPAKP